MDRLTSQFIEIRKIRDCAAVHALLLDCWMLAQERGEEEALRFAAVYRRGIEEYERQRKALALFGRWKKEAA